MTLQERIEKTEKTKDYLSGISLVLSDLNDTRFPSWEVRTAISHVRKAITELEKDIHNLKQMDK